MPTSLDPPLHIVHNLHSIHPQCVRTVPLGDITTHVNLLSSDVGGLDIFAESTKTCNFIMYVDDTTLSSTIDSFSTHEDNGNVEFSINIECQKSVNGLNKLSLNLDKTKYMLFKTATRKCVNPPLLKTDNINIDRVHEFYFLGLTFNEQLNWKCHIDNISNGVQGFYVF